MKTNIILAGIALASVAFTSCSNDSSVLDLQEVGQTNGKAHVRLAITTGMEVTTRASLVANDKALTDLYILDYVGGTLKQVLHQMTPATDFAEPDITLDYGTHTLRVIATRSETPTLLDAANAPWQHTANVLCTVAPGASAVPVALTSTKISDTFAATKEITVSTGTSTSVSITLDRIVARLLLDIKDTYPVGCSTVQISLNEHKALTLADLSVTDAVANQRTMNVSDLAGMKQQIAFYFLTPADGYTTDITFTMNRTTGTPFAQFTLPAVPLTRNKVTTISGSFYNHQQGFQMTCNDTWDTEGTNINI